MYSEVYKGLFQATAIIDVGLDEPTFRMYSGATAFYIVKERVVRIFDELNLSGTSSHGGQSLKFFEIGSYRPPDVFVLLQHDKNGKCNVDDLITALDWCAVNNISLISLSMGTTQYSDAEKLAEATRRVYKNGICLVAGASNEGLLSYPACFQECIGVRFDTASSQNEDIDFVYYKDSCDGIDIVINPHINESLQIDSTSIATAYFAGLVASAVFVTGAFYSLTQWLTKHKLDLPQSRSYAITLSSIRELYYEDVLVVAAKGFSLSPRVIKYCREMQRCFVDSDYHCVLLYPECSLVAKTIYERSEFCQPDISGCSYFEYCRLVIHLCRPSLIIVDFDNYVNEIDVLLYSTDDTYNGVKENELMIIDIDAHAPAEVVNSIIETFDK